MNLFYTILLTASMYQQPTVLCKGQHITEQYSVELIEAFGQQFIIHRDKAGNVFGNLMKVNMSLSEFSNYCIMNNYKPEC